MNFRAKILDFDPKLDFENDQKCQFLQFWGLKIRNSSFFGIPNSKIFYQIGFKNQIQNKAVFLKFNFWTKTVDF